MTQVLPIAPLNEKVSSGMKVSVVPYLGDINPYQDNLIEHLFEMSVATQKVNSYQAYLPTVVSAWQPQVVHLHWIHQFFQTPSAMKATVRFAKFIAGLVRLRQQGKKIVWTAHNLKNHNSQHPFIDNLATRLVVQLSDKIIVHSEAAKAEIIQQFQIKSQTKLCVIPHANYIDQYPSTVTPAQARQTMEISKDSFVVLFFGLIRAYKGIPELLKAFESLPSAVDGIQLLIAGSSQETELLDSIEKSCKRDKRIRLEARFIPSDQVQMYMNACDVVVLPYRQFLTSGAVLLAMSFARACIAPRRGCISELLDDSGAFLYDPDDPNSLSRAIQAAHAQRAVVADMGRHNYRKVQAWDWAFVAKEHLGVYQSCFP